MKCEIHTSVGAGVVTELGSPHRRLIPEHLRLSLPSGRFRLLSDIIPL